MHSCRGARCQRTSDVEWILDCANRATRSARAMSPCGKPRRLRARCLERSIELPPMHLRTAHRLKRRMTRRIVTRWTSRSGGSAPWCTWWGSQHAAIPPLPAIVGDAPIDVPPDVSHVVLTWQLATLSSSGAPDALTYPPFDSSFAPQVRMATLDGPFEPADYSSTDAGSRSRAATSARPGGSNPTAPRSRSHARSRPRRNEDGRLTGNLAWSVCA